MDRQGLANRRDSNEPAESTTERISHDRRELVCTCDEQLDPHALSDLIHERYIVAEAALRTS